MDNFKVCRDSVTIFRARKYSDVYRYLVFGGRYVGLFWKNKMIAWTIRIIHLVLQIGLIATSGFHYFQVPIASHYLYESIIPNISIIFGLKKNYINKTFR